MRFLPLLFFFTCLSCTNHNSSKTGDYGGKSPNEGNQLAISRDSVDYTQRYDPSKPEGQQTSSSQGQNKKKVHNCIFFLCSVKQSSKLTIYNTQYYELEKSGLVEMQLAINSLKQCLTDELKSTLKLTEDIKVTEFKFNSKKEAQDYFSNYIKKLPKAPLPFLSVNCPN